MVAPRRTADINVSIAEKTILSYKNFAHAKEITLAIRRAVSGPKPIRTAGATADGSSRKVLRALLAFSVDRPRHSAESLAEAIGLPLSSTYRYLAILREAELIDEEGRGSFVLAPRVIGLAQAARAGTDLASIARPYMRRLSQETGETVILVRRSGDRAVCIERVESSSRIRLSFDVGTALPLHRGASPKMLLAHLPPAELDAMLGDLVAHEPGFGAQRNVLLKELAVIRDRGWTESHQEITPHVYAVAVGIFDATGVIATLTIAAPAFRTPRASQIKLRGHLETIASDITQAYAAVTF
jgi:DNA-binding IclR family transcriptional regulator